MDRISKAGPAIVNIISSVKLKKEKFLFVEHSNRKSKFNSV